MHDFEPTVLVTGPSIDGKPFIRETNVTALKEVGLQYVVVHPGMSRVELRNAWEETDGTLRTGGLDIKSERFGQTRHPNSDIPDEARDEMEATIVEWDLEEGRPSINTCLGLQWLFWGLKNLHQTVTFQSSAKLIQHLPETTSERHGSEKPSYDNLFSPEALTEVHLQPGTQMHHLYLRPGMQRDKEIVVYIPCEHHQTIDKKSAVNLDGFIINALSPEGIIEGFEISKTINPYALATQGHIEVAPNAVRRPYFQGFADVLKNRPHNYFVS